MGTRLIERDSQERPPAALLLSREVVSVDAETGEVTLAFAAKPEFLNRHGTVQGGLLAAMLDAATANAVLLRLPEGETAVTMRLDTRFLRPAALGAFSARARQTGRDGRTAFAYAELSDEGGTVVATANCEMRIRPAATSIG